MKNKQIRLFVADVDNTLRGTHEELFVKGQNSMTIAPALTKTFIELHNHGILLAIASGRPLWQELSHHHIDWNLPFQFDAIIGLNGGEVYDNADGTTRLLGFSAGNDVIEGNDGVLVEVTLKAEGNFDAYSAVKLSDMVFVETNGTAHQLDDLTLVNGIATGVEQVNTTARIYGHEGHIVIEAAESGLAQIVMANGMSRTVKVATGRNDVPMPAGMYIVKMNNAVAKIKL